MADMLVKKSRLSRMPAGSVGDDELAVFADLITPKALYVRVYSSRNSIGTVYTNLSRAVVSTVRTIKRSSVIGPDTWQVRPVAEPNQNGPSVESFLQRAQRLVDHGRTDSALDLVYDQIDEMLLAGDFPGVDQLLVDTETDHYSVHLLLAVLTVTLSARDQLSGRADFFTRAEQTLQARGEMKAGLLTGLE